MNVDLHLLAVITPFALMTLMLVIDYIEKNHEVKLP